MRAHSRSSNADSHRLAPSSRPTPPYGGFQMLPRSNYPHETHSGVATKSRHTTMSSLRGEDAWLGDHSSRSFARRACRYARGLRSSSTARERSRTRSHGCSSQTARVSCTCSQRQAPQGAAPLIRCARCCSATACSSAPASRTLRTAWAPPVRPAACETHRARGGDPSPCGDWRSFAGCSRSGCRRT